VAFPKLSETVITAIKAAPAREKPADTAARLSKELAAELGRPLSASTVKKYRAEGRAEHRDVAREELAAHVREHTAGALEDLAELRRTARQAYLAGGHFMDGGLWLNAIREELKAAGAIEPSTGFEGWTDEELEAYARGERFSGLDTGEGDTGDGGAAGAAGSGAEGVAPA
jgi:hypothetical protein